MAVFYGTLGDTSLGELVFGEVSFIPVDLDETEYAALFTNKGEEWLVDAILNPEDILVYIGWSDGSGTINKDDTALWNEVGTRTACFVEKSGTGADAKVLLNGTLTADGTYAISDVGIFTEQAGGDLILHSTCDILHVQDGDIGKFEFQLDPK